MADVGHFVGRLLREKATEVDVAVGAVWYVNQSEPATALTSGELARMINDGGGSKPNTTRLRKNLEADPRVISSRKDEFKINIRHRDVMDAKFKPFSGPLKPDNSGSVLPVEPFSNARRYVKEILHQINASYDAALFDCCAVMCRRIFETLIIDAFDKQGEVELIKDENGDIATLSGLILALKTQRAFTVGRTTKNASVNIKKVGDLSAHNRTFIAQAKHIDDIAHDLYGACTDLLHLSGQD
ncbi:MAG: hypothetical protein ACJ8EB_03960 [Allosphingosinicella sp.]